MTGNAGKIMNTEESARLLVVDDEEDTTDLLSYQLESAGFAVRAVNEPRKVLDTVREYQPDLMLLDIMMPGLSGIQILNTIKNDSDIRRLPVIFLTAKGDTEDRIRGFETGVDDYIAKPFNTKELVLRVRAVLKRANAERVVGSRTITVGPIVADKDLHKINIDGTDVLLTSLEYKLMQLLMENFNQILSRESLLAKVWNYDSSTETRTVDTHVRRLREKLGGRSDMIETVRGRGYRMILPMEE